MSVDLRARLRERVDRLQSNLLAIQSIRARGQDDRPEPLDLPGLAWLLESCYSDIEEVLKGVAQEFGEPPGEAASWHRDLLQQMAMATTNRKPVIPIALATALEDYLSFRHFSRYSTFVILEWDKMRPLVDDLPTVVQDFADAVESFLADMGR